MSKVVFKRPEALLPVTTHYCPGCSHGIVHRIIAECIDELGVRERTIGVAPVGCSVLAYNYFNTDFFEASHGRAPAVATGAKRARPDLIIFAYQGDGDLASIGMAEIVHSCNRGEKITVIFINNTVYGMTGGQMAPTTMPGQVTTTSPYGRDVAHIGWPIRMCELLSSLRTEGFIARTSTHSTKEIIKTKRTIKKAFELQVANRCFTFVEVLSTCPTNWGMTPKQAQKRLLEEMVPYFPLGIFKSPNGDEPKS